MAEGKAQAKDTRLICLRTDLPQQQRRPVQDAVRNLFQKIVQKDDKKHGLTARWGEFARVLKASLDKSFEPHWHVLVGRQLGFACKKRDQTMGMWRVGETSIMIWKSPGLEGPPLSPGAASSDAASSEPRVAEAAEDKESDVPEAKAADGADAGGPEASAQAAEAAPRAAKGVAAASLRVVRPTNVEAGSEVEQTITFLREELASANTEDVQELAQILRRRLMSELGPIWHVVVGAEFTVEAAVNCQNFVLATAGKMRIVCFQHEQFRESRIDFQKIFKAAPYLLVALFCFAYMTLQAVCQEQAPRANFVLSWRIRNKFCHEGWEQDMAYVGGCALIGLYMSTKWKMFFPQSKG